MVTMLSSVRIVALFFHFLMTLGLLWTRSNMIMVMLPVSSRYNTALIKQYDDDFLGLIIFNLVLLLVQFIALGKTMAKIDITSVMHAVLDVLASFFIFWMILDGWDWRTFIFLLVFCSIVPTAIDVFQFILYVVKKMKMS